MLQTFVNIAGDGPGNAQYLTLRGGQRALSDTSTASSGPGISRLPTCTTLLSALSVGDRGRIMDGSGAPLRIDQWRWPDSIKPASLQPGSQQCLPVAEDCSASQQSARTRKFAACRHTFYAFAPFFTIPDGLDVYES